MEEQVTEETAEEQVTEETAEEQVTEEQEAPEADANSEAPEAAAPSSAGVSRDAVEGILNQLVDSRDLLASASSPKVKKAVSKLTEAITWLNDALGSTPKASQE